MLDPAIATFLAERKTTWLKEKLKTCKTEAEQQDVESKAIEKFSLVNWLPDAAKRSGQLAMVSHPGKFTHPSAKTSAIIAKYQTKPDGFLRTGNAQADFDVFGNAAALDVYKFLSLILTDGQTVLAHLEQDSDSIKTQFSFSSVPITELQSDLFNPQSNDTFTELQQDLLAIKQTSSTVKTSEKIKQVYFPVDDDYHLLSILTPSGLMFKLKERINVLRFSEDAKQARKDRYDQKYNETGFDDIYGLSVIGFGGTKPQNISVLNNQNGGTAYLLSSLPPTLEKHRTRRPNKSFFADVLWIKAYHQELWQLQKRFTSYQDNKETKLDIAEIITSIFQQVIENVWQLRQLDTGWSDSTKLPTAQKIWLDDAYSEQREAEDDWLNEIIADFARWLRFAYIKSIGKEKAIPLGDDELRHIKQLIVAYQEDLR